jgi:hypothetical protein
MKSLPELWELVALFEAEPVNVYGEEKEIPWFYSTLNFKLKRENETLDITISPAYGSIDIWVFTGDKKIMQVSLENVIEMNIEKLHNKEFLHILFNENGAFDKFFIQTKPHIFIHCGKE